jgi:prepilin-type N-terminal cleavage/methylation domain-containing protein
MSGLKRSKSQAGFTLIEIIVAMTVASIIAIAAYQFFGFSFNAYFDLQQNATVTGELAQNAQNIANVVRGLTGISSADANDLTMYAYFFPNDTYVSKVRYYLNATATQLMAEVTPMTANPPIGQPITNQKRTYTIIADYKKLPGLNLFGYLDASGNSLAMPVTDLNIVKQIQINLAVPVNHPTPGGNKQISLQISLRNRKTNL